MLASVRTFTSRGTGSFVQRLIPTYSIRLFSQGGLVTTDWLRENIEDPSVKVLDASRVPMFLHSTLPHALRLSLPGSLKGQDSNVVVSGDEFEAAANLAGLSNSDKIVVYDSSVTMTATRHWWAFKRYGVDVAILDGGWKKWVREGGKMDSGMKKALSSLFSSGDKDSQNVEAHFKIKQNDSVFYSMDRLAKAVGTKGVHVVDARSPHEFSGRIKMNKRGGHVPGAVNMPHSLFLNDDGTLKSDEALKEFARHAGLPKPKSCKPIVSYCQSGARATIPAFALSKIGYTIGVYDASMSEWANAKDTLLISNK